MKLGRQKRARSPIVPHYSALMAGVTLAPPPVSVNYLASMPAALGMMLNDTLGDCTCAAVFHSIQVWTNMTGAMLTCPDADVLTIYETFCGFNPANPATDQGGVEQTVLADWMNIGVPTPTASNRLSAWIEVDPRNQTDIKQVINACGTCYIGFNVPSNIMPSNAPPPSVWTYDASATDLGGHAVVLAGYDADTVSLISWGAKYQMTWEFFTHYTDEAYALINPDWASTTGTTPLNMTLSQLEDQMNALKTA